MVRCFFHPYHCRLIFIIESQLFLTYIFVSCLFLMSCLSECFFVRNYRRTVRKFFVRNYRKSVRKLFVRSCFSETFPSESFQFQRKSFTGVNRYLCKFGKTVYKVTLTEYIGFSKASTDPTFGPLSFFSDFFSLLFSDFFNFFSFCLRKETKIDRLCLHVRYSNAAK